MLLIERQDRSLSFDMNNNWNLCFPFKKVILSVASKQLSHLALHTESYWGKFVQPRQPQSPPSSNGERWIKGQYVHSLESWDKEGGSLWTASTLQPQSRSLSRQQKTQAAITGCCFFCAWHFPKHISNHAMRRVEQELWCLIWGSEKLNDFSKVTKLVTRRNQDWVFLPGFLSHTLGKKSQNGSCPKLFLEILWLLIDFLMGMSWESAENKNGTQTHHREKGSLGWGWMEKREERWFPRQTSQTP